LVPGDLAEELLQALALLVVPVGDALGVLALPVGDEPGHVVVGVGALGAGPGGDERSQEALQAGGDPPPDRRGDGRPGEQLMQPHTKPTPHTTSPERLTDPKEAVGKKLQRLKMDTVKLLRLFLSFPLIIPDSGSPVSARIFFPPAIP